MGQKVWVIDDDYWKESPGKRLSDVPPSPERQADSQSLAKAPQKSPAVSFSLSMLLWGGGHLYLGAYRVGAVCLAAMAFFYSMLAAMVFFRGAVSSLFVGIGVQKPVFVIGALVFLAAGLLTWLGNAVAAYYRAARSRSEPFPGVENAFCILIGSLLFPGWGQFLNAQPKKGTFFLLFGMTGVLSAVICFTAPYAWPILKDSPARFAAESGLVINLLLAPISLLMWIVASFESLGARREIARRRLRSHHAGYRLRNRMGVRALVPRGTAVLSLLLAISVGMQFIPRGFYLDTLEKVRIEALNRDMEIFPRLIRKIKDVVDR